MTYNINSVEYKTAMETFKYKVAIKKNYCFLAIRDILQADSKQLSNMGHKTVESAFKGIFEYYEKEINKITKEFLNQYPD